MADVNKIQLPDNSTVNIKDYRIPGVDTEPTSGSDNIITSGGIYQVLVDDEEVISAALNDLNSRLIDIESVDFATTAALNNAITTLETEISQSSPGSLSTSEIDTIWNNAS